MSIGWDCPRCRLLNPITYPECYRCHCPKPGVSEPTPTPKPQPEAPKTPKPTTPSPTKETPQPPTKNGGIGGILQGVRSVLSPLAAALSVAAVFVPQLRIIAAVLNALKNSLQEMQDD